MTLEINLGIKREKRLKKHLEVEHPSTKGRIKIENGKKIMYKKNKCFKTKRQIKRILMNVPDFAAQQREFIKI